MKIRSKFSSIEQFIYLFLGFEPQIITVRHFLVAGLYCTLAYDKLHGYSASASLSNTIIAINYGNSFIMTSLVHANTLFL